MFEGIGWGARIRTWEWRNQNPGGNFNDSNELSEIWDYFLAFPSLKSRGFLERQNGPVTCSHAAMHADGSSSDDEITNEYGLFHRRYWRSTLPPALLNRLDVTYSPSFFRGTTGNRPLNSPVTATPVCKIVSSRLNASRP